jgi:hypothetical protein
MPTRIATLFLLLQIRYVAKPLGPVHFEFNAELYRIEQGAATGWVARYSEREQQLFAILAAEYTKNRDGSFATGSMQSLRKHRPLNY